MSAVRNALDSADSVIPSIGSGRSSGPDPEPDAYRCRNCGRDAEPDAETCPNCSSANLRPLYF